MADNAEASVALYEGIHENPELIWSEETRQQTSLYLERSARDLSQQQAKNPEIDWKPPTESFLPNKEFILGGVYIRLLLQNPGWQLRRPKEFITQLFDRITDLTEPTNGNVDQNELDQLSEAGCGLFTTQINLSKLGKDSLLIAILDVIFSSWHGNSADSDKATRRNAIFKTYSSSTQRFVHGIKLRWSNWRDSRVAQGSQGSHGKLIRW